MWASNGSSVAQVSTVHTVGRRVAALDGSIHTQTFSGTLGWHWYAAILCLLCQDKNDISSVEDRILIGSNGVGAAR